MSRSARKAAVRRRIALVLSGESSRAGQRPRSPAESRLANHDVCDRARCAASSVYVTRRSRPADPRGEIGRWPDSWRTACVHAAECARQVGLARLASRAVRSRGCVVVPTSRRDAPASPSALDSENVGLVQEERAAEFGEWHCRGEMDRVRSSGKRCQDDPESVGHCLSSWRVPYWYLKGVLGHRGDLKERRGDGAIAREVSQRLPVDVGRQAAAGKKGVIRLGAGARQQRGFACAARLC